MKRYLLISSDCHHGAPWEGFRPYIEPRYLDEFDAWVADKRAMAAETRAWRMKHFSQKFQERYNRGAEAKVGRPGDMDWDIGIDAIERWTLLEADGVVGEVIFPDNSRLDAIPFRQPGGPLAGQIDAAAAGSRAYNRWLADYCAEDRNRRLGIAVVAMSDLDAALEEIGWAKRIGMRGIVITTTPELEGAPSYDSDYYDPVWSLCEELDMPVHTHGGMPAGQRILAEMMWAGVFERHPKIRAVWTEQGASWIPQLLEELDVIYQQPHSGARLRRQLSLTPSQYWERNCWVGHSVRHLRADWDLRHRIGVHKMMWGNDFPHSEGGWPYTQETLQRCFSDVPEAETRAVLGENAAEFYGVDLAALAPVVERTGIDAALFQRGQTAATEETETAINTMMAASR